VTTAPAAAIGNASIDSNPRGAAVFIDGIAQGTTPSKIAVPAGQHTLELKLDGITRSFELNVDSGTTASHYIELASPAAKPVGSTGRLEIASDPPGAQVIVNGSAKGRTPLTLNDVLPGEHVVAISSGSETVNRKVSVAAGNTASVFASLGPTAAAAGWVAFKTPVDLQIFEAKRLVGTTAADRLMLPAGRHELELVNTELEFRRPLTVQVGAGTTVNAAVEVPSGSLSISALPWAEVTIDGRPLGTTPLGNLAIPIGSYEVVWRHPQLGERRRTVTVPATTPVRVGVDLSQ
jgi:serine/threonine-protein kinase